MEKFQANNSLLYVSIKCMRSTDLAIWLNLFEVNKQVFNSMPTFSIIQPLFAADSRFNDLVFSPLATVSLQCGVAGLRGFAKKKIQVYYGSGWLGRLQVSL